MKHLIKYFAITSLIVVSSCRKLDIGPTDAYSALNFWTADANVYNALNNNYSLMYNSGLYFGNEGLSDNAYSQNNNDLIQIASGNANSLTSKFAGDWAYYYSTIKSCNQFLANVDQNTSLGAATINRLKAEVRFIRAFEHFNLTKWYGDVPLVTTDITQEEAKNIAKTPKAEVVNFVVSELKAILPALPSKDQLPATENGRITKGAALALEARVLLYQGDRMAEVVSVCEDIMNNTATNGTYSLTPNYSNLFSDPNTNRNSPEVILSLQYVPATTRTWTDFWDFAPNSVGGRVSSLAPTQELVDDYVMLNGRGIAETGSGYDEANPYANRDPRLTATVVYDRYNWNNGGGANGTSKVIYIKPGSDPTRPGPDEYSAGRQSSSPTGYYWRKYFDPTALANFTSGNNLHLFRYAEVLLNYAEAKNSLGQMDAAVWNKTIGALRTRAGFTDANALTYPGGNITNIIRRERRAEFAMEGIRIDDIRRWRIAETVLNRYVHGAKFSGDPTTDNGYIRVQLRRFNPNRDYLWAIPSGDQSLNARLTQNPGY
jgi:hypothetical protein